MRKFTKAGIAAIMAAALFCAGMPAYATPKNEIASHQEYVTGTGTSLQDIEARIANLEAKKGQTEEYLREVNNQLAELTEQLKELEIQFSDKQLEIDAINVDLAGAEADKAVQHENMKVRIQYMYENSEQAGSVVALFSGTDIMEMLTAANDFSELESYDREMLESYANICQQIEDTRARLEKEQEAIELLREKSRTKKDELQIVCNETREQVEEIAASLKNSQSEEAYLVQMILAQQAAIDVITRDVAEEIAAADAAAGQTVQAPGVSAPAEDSSSPQDSSSQDSGSSSLPADVPGDTSDTVQETPAGNQGLSLNNYNGPVLDRQSGKIRGPECEETYYNLDMSGVVDIMRNMGNTDEYWVRDDGVKMLGDYVIVAANLDEYPRGSLVPSSLGMAIVCDTGGFAVDHPDRLDVAVSW